MSHKHTKMHEDCIDCWTSAAVNFESAQVSGTERVIELAEQFGYGHLISALRCVWRDKLIAQGISRKAAIEATNKAPYEKLPEWGTFQKVMEQLPPQLKEE